MNLHPTRVAQLATAVLAVGILAMGPALAQQPTSDATEVSSQLSSEVASDVLDSYQKLVQTPYRQVDPQSLIDAARGAMLTEAHKHGVHINLPAIQASDDDRATTSQLDQEIELAAVTAHTAATTYAYAAMTGMAQAVDDKWTVFMNPEEFRKFNDVLDPEKISGIGVMVEVDPVSKFVRAYFVVPGTPADKAGIESGDVFLSVDGTSTKGMNDDSVSKLLRGKAGSVVHIIYAPSASEAGRDVAVTRSEVQPPTVVYKMLPGSVGYIYVLAFGKETPDEFNLAVDRVKAEGARALIFDLRNDGGGYVESALEISSRFVARKALVTVQERGSDALTYCAHGSPVTGAPSQCANMSDDSPDLPLIALPTTVLVNEYTASASEITAGALQDDGVGTLVGTKTYGKGVMQTLTPLADGSAIKITTAHYLTPAQHDINLRGIEPDVRVDASKSERFGDVSSDTQLRAALELLQKKVADTKS